MKLFSERYNYTHPSDVIIREQITPEIQNAICWVSEQIDCSVNRLMKVEDNTANDTLNDTANDTVKIGVSILTKTEIKVLKAISSFPKYSYEELATYCQLSRPTIARAIKTLQGYEYIRRIGSDKTGHWVIVK